MRIDKFLKLSRIIKRRSIAKIVIDEKKIKINNKLAKPSTSVNINDIIEIEYFNQYLKVKVVNIANNNITKDKAHELYEIVDSRKIDQIK